MKNVIPRLDWLDGYDDVRIDRAAYGNGQLAWRIFGIVPEGYEELLAVVTVNLAEYKLYPAKHGWFFIRDYGQHEGLGAALWGASVVEPTGRQVTFGPYGTTAREYKFTPEYEEEFGE